MYMHKHDKGHMWTSEDNLQELVFSFHHIRSKDQTESIKLGSRQIY